jgi:phospholipid/cholesterol/gamma-HCH transport system substrate-binding protein
VRIRSEGIKLAVFVTVGALLAALLYLTLGEVTLGPSRSYRAMMTDASGLKSGDVVRVAGVRVGQVDDLQVESGNRVAVSFHVDEGQQLTDRTQVMARYENLLGDRYLELAQLPGEGEVLDEGATIPDSRTTPALDLDVLLNGFRPLFQGLAPEQVNQLATSLIDTLQGRGGTVESLLQQAGELTNGLADHDKSIGSLIGNLDTVLATLDSRDLQLRTSITQMRNLLGGLAADRDPIADALVRINGFSESLAVLLADVRTPFAGLVLAAHDVAALLNKNSARLEKTLEALPEAYQRLSRIASHGSFFDFYLCSVQVVLGAPNGVDLKSPVIRSTVKRCN